MCLLANIIGMQTFHSCLCAIAQDGDYIYLSYKLDKCFSLCRILNEASGLLLHLGLLLFALQCSLFHKLMQVLTPFQATAEEINFSFWCFCMVLRAIFSCYLCRYAIKLNNPSGEDAVENYYFISIG